MAQCPCLNRSATSKLSEPELLDMAAPWELLIIGSQLATPTGLATD